MITGPKFKIARRLGAPIFEKTQNAKFKARLGEIRRSGPKSDFGKQMIEKQKARFTYGISEKQFSKYVKAVIGSKTTNPTNALFEKLERRLDNAVYRLGICSTRRFARQIVSHGHILVNDRRVTIPSFDLKPGDQISIRKGSASNSIFKEFNEKVKSIETPLWLTWNTDRLQASVLRMPSVEGQELLFDLGAVIEFYKR